MICRHCGDRVAFPRDLARRTIRADNLERDRAIAERMLILMDDAELCPSNRTRFMVDVLRASRGKPAKTQRRRRQAKRMFDDEPSRRAARTAHQILSDRAARVRLLRELEPASC